MLTPLQNWGPGVYFNALVDLKLPGGKCSLLSKYGVVSTASVLDDLRTWRHLYLAGRIHKPVKRVSLSIGVNEPAQGQGPDVGGRTENSTRVSLSKAIQDNREEALQLALMRQRADPGSASGTTSSSKDGEFMRSRLRSEFLQGLPHDFLHFAVVF